MDANIRVQFLGGLAGDNLTGSCTLLTVAYKKKISRFLIDAGLIQCRFEDFFKKNRGILAQLSPRKLDAIIATHPHIDHIGDLPLLVKNGFSGPIICTEATGTLLNVMLEDSAKIQAVESDDLKAKTIRKELAAFKNRQTRKRSRPGRKIRGNYGQIKSELKRNVNGELDPLYDLDDVKATVGLVKNGGHPYNVWIRLSKGVSLKFYPSGHVLGGAICVIKIETNKKAIFIGFSGDLGRRDGIIFLWRQNPPRTGPRDNPALKDHRTSSQRKEKDNYPIFRPRASARDSLSFELLYENWKDSDFTDISRFADGSKDN